MRPALPAVLALLAAASPAGATVTAVAPAPPRGPAVVAPGITYERLVRGGPQVIHVVRVRPGPRRAVGTALVAGNPLRRGSLAAAVRARRDAGAVAGMNADLFNAALGYPSGVLVLGGELLAEPEPGRSSVAFGPDGVLSVGLLAFRGSVQAAPSAGRTPPPRRIDGINRYGERTTETVLYTPGFGAPATPSGRGRAEARIRLDAPGPLVPNQPRAGTVVGTGAGGTPIGAGHVVVTGIGTAGRGVAADLVPGVRVTLQAAVEGLPAGVSDVSGGGPVLVRDGVPVKASGEAFTAGQLYGRTSRSALGQAADGTILLVSAEGPRQGSVGQSVAEQAESLAGLGARTAIGMDGGGSSQIVVRDRLVTPWNAPRRVTTAFVARYAGVQLEELPARLSPNADRVDDRATTVVRAAVLGQVRVTAVRRRGGRTARLLEAAIGPGSAAVTVDPRTQRLPDGVYDLVARQEPADGSPASVHRRRVVVDRTLSHLTARPVRRGRRAALDIGFRLRAPARVTVEVRSTAGAVLRRLTSGRRLGRGRRVVTWDRRIGNRVLSGRVVVRVTATARLGPSGLERPVRLPRPRGRAAA